MCPASTGLELVVPTLDYQLAAQLLQAGIFEAVLLKAGHSGAFVLLRAADLAAARDAIGRLPLVAKGLTKVEFTHVMPFDTISGSPAPQSAP